MDDGFIKRIDELKALVRETDPEILQERIYACVANGCILLTAYMKTEGRDGWSSMLVNGEGQPILNSSEQTMIESAFKSAPWILSFLKDRHVQVGGAAAAAPSGAPAPDLDSHGSFVTPVIEYVSNMTGDDVSLDLLLDTFIKKTTEMDAFWSDMKHNTFGMVTSFINTDSEIYVPTPTGVPIPVPIPKRPIIYFLIMLLDSFRLSRALSGHKDIPLTLVVLLEELVTGQWRQMLLTAAGFISPSGVAIGVIAKFFVNAWVLINPNIRTHLVKDMYKGSKSMFIGFILWCVSVLPPEIIKNRLKESIDGARELVVSFDEKIKKLEEQGSVALKPLGKKMVFKGVSLDELKKITIEDIQNLQSLAQWPLLICTKEYQDIQGPLEKDPMFRVLLELIGVPTIADDKFEVCRSNKFKSIEDVIAESLDPADAIVDDPEFVNPLTALQGQVQGAVSDVQQQAQGAVSDVQQQAQGAVAGVQQQAQGAVAGVQGQVQGAVAGVQAQAQGAVAGVQGAVAGVQQQAQSVANVSKKIGTMVGGATGVGSKRKTRRRNHST